MIAVSADESKPYGTVDSSLDSDRPANDGSANGGSTNDGTPSESAINILVAKDLFHSNCERKDLQFCIELMSLKRYHEVYDGSKN